MNFIIIKAWVGCLIQFNIKFTVIIIAIIIQFWMIDYSKLRQEFR